MIKIDGINIENFKNLNNVDISFNKKRIICIVGINGVGKTNILKAINSHNKNNFINNDFKVRQQNTLIKELLLKVHKYSKVSKKFDDTNEMLLSNFSYFPYLDDNIISNLVYIENIDNIYAKYDFVKKISDCWEDVFKKNYVYTAYLNKNLKGKLFRGDWVEKIFEEINKYEYNNLIHKNINRNNDEKFPQIILNFFGQSKEKKLNNFVDKQDFIIHDYTYVKREINSNNFIFDKKYEFSFNGLIGLQTELRDLKSINEEIGFNVNVNIIYEDNFNKILIKNNENLKDNKSILRKLILTLFENDPNILDKIKNLPAPKSEKLVNEINESLTNFFFSDWQSENLKFKMTKENVKNLEFSNYIEVFDENNSIAENKEMLFEELSSGHLWHIAMKILFLEIDKNIPTIILLDEPSNHLHIDSQRSLVNFFEKFIRENKNIYLIYNTHSPFMISKNASYLSFDERQNKWIFYEKIENFERDNRNLRALLDFNLHKVNLKMLFEILHLNVHERILQLLKKKEYTAALTACYKSLEEKMNKVLQKKNIITKNMSGIALVDKFIKEIKMDFSFDELKIEFRSFFKMAYNFQRNVRNKEGNAHNNEMLLDKETYEYLIFLGLILSNLIEKWET